MIQDKSQPVTLHGQVSALAIQAAKLRDGLLQKVKPRDLPVNADQDLGNLADTLAKIGQKFEAFEAEHSNMQALAQIGGVVNSSLELDEVLQQILVIAREYFHLQNVAILLLDKDTRQLVVRSQIGWDEGLDSVSLSVGEGITGAAAVEKRPDDSRDLGEPDPPREIQPDAAHHQHRFRGFCARRVQQSDSLQPLQQHQFIR